MHRASSKSSVVAALAPSQVAQASPPRTAVVILRESSSCPLSPKASAQIATKANFWLRGVWMVTACLVACSPRPQLRASRRELHSILTHGSLVSKRDGAAPKNGVCRTLVAAFVDSGQVGEFIIHVIPKMIGEGIPLIAPQNRDLGLKLLASKKSPDGVIRLHYAVQAT